MPPIFNTFPNPSLFNFRHFRISYSLLPPIRNLISRSVGHDAVNVVSIACGTALELSTFELLARSREIKVNYLGCDINKRDLRFNARVLQPKSPSVKQAYVHADIASSPPVAAIAKAHCIIWRHPEFLSDHAETPKELILDMCQILWHVLDNKDEKAPLLITCYDPHEMMLVIELIQQFCEADLKYDLSIDTQHGRASWQNPIVAPEDLDPLFNLNHHDQCQLLITQCRLKSVIADRELFLTTLSRAFHTVLSRVQAETLNPLLNLLENLNKPNLDVLREAVSYLNNQIRENSAPFMKREELLTVLTMHYEQSEILNQSTCCI
ncbi:hypothetical protein [Legionella micdadei]|uniref:Methyltransferase domain-containing protein n=1 Tax=Legionella micdadei TaxID=451 RepID=A0A098GGF3_LEGMI|nr:hypothetical protein [Legionella micdadei]ARG97017.1 hypothetical protein B6N58_04660 [Legionella micdadei]KTD26732.1 hypothetical protein Lmic_2826 [Legionella micdadei]NSL18237.1 hypothetical protein [Legionella micdadei]CEG61569.1 protein of unknown function [Legionella micdadei]SCY46132.1 hypothetical protein SAMN02982997_01777 [Legionella micdadei]